MVMSDDSDWWGASRDITINQWDLGEALRRVVCSNIDEYLNK